jgi:ATP-dependent RNA helicase SUPV3L1/SUV3
LNSAEEPLPLDLLARPAERWSRSDRRRLTRISTDLRLPHETFPLARTMKRVIHAHVGPTNSGKTHHALEALASAASGVYCGPLRLLAFEIHDRLNSGSVPCTLRTGQELIEVANSQHTACTVEMTSLQRPLEVGVLDEVQMLSHPERGWAWSRVVLGLPARQLHVCGSADALPLIRSLVEACGDELVEHHYERLTPLSVTDSLNGDLSRVRRGDCVVAFSRREIFQLKQKVEEATGLRCGVVYGSLPPETRREQAKRFNDPAEAEEVLVASDAIGMGLNLNIQRVVFASLAKYDGEQVRPLEPTEVKQIAGR